MTHTDHELAEQLIIVSRAADSLATAITEGRVDILSMKRLALRMGPLSAVMEHHATVLAGRVE